MATLEVSDIADLVIAAQRDLGRMKFTEIATGTQEHVAFNTLFRRERVQFKTGRGIQFNVMTTHSDAAKWVGLYEVDDVNVGDVLTTGNAPWRHITTNRGIDAREISMDQSPAAVVDLVQVNRVDSMISMAEKFEQRFWRLPGGSTDKLNPFGVPYWIVYNATEGFNGGNPSGYSDGAGGISSSTYTRWDNWANQYTNVTKDDLVRKARKASTFTRFMAPVGAEHPNYMRGPDRYGYYTTYAVLGTMEEILESQNENLGNDVASKDGRTVFRQRPVTWVPELENLAGDPFYGINWSVFYVGVLSGWFMRETGPKPSPNAHTVIVNHTDTTCQIVCKDRRKQFVIATADPVG